MAPDRKQLADAGRKKLEEFRRAKAGAGKSPVTSPDPAEKAAPSTQPEQDASATASSPAPVSSHPFPGAAVTPIQLWSDSSPQVNSGTFGGATNIPTTETVQSVGVAPPSSYAAPANTDSYAAATPHTTSYSSAGSFVVASGSIPFLSSSPAPAKPSPAPTLYETAAQPYSNLAAPPTSPSPAPQPWLHETTSQGPFGPGKTTARTAAASSGVGLDTGLGQPPSTGQQDVLHAAPASQPCASIQPVAPARQPWASSQPAAPASQPWASSQPAAPASQPWASSQPAASPSQPWTSSQPAAPPVGGVDSQSTSAASPAAATALTDTRAGPSDSSPLHGTFDTAPDSVTGKQDDGARGGSLPWSVQGAEVGTVATSSSPSPWIAPGSSWLSSRGLDRSDATTSAGLAHDAAAAQQLPQQLPAASQAASEAVATTAAADSSMSAPLAGTAAGTWGAVQRVDENEASVSKELVDPSLTLSGDDAAQAPAPPTSSWWSSQTQTSQPAAELKQPASQAQPTPTVWGSAASSQPQPTTQNFWSAAPSSQSDQPAEQLGQQQPAWTSSSQQQHPTSLDPSGHTEHGINPAPSPDPTSYPTVSGGYSTWTGMGSHTPEAASRPASANAVELETPPPPQPVITPAPTSAANAYSALSDQYLNPTPDSKPNPYTSLSDQYLFPAPSLAAQLAAQPPATKSTPSTPPSKEAVGLTTPDASTIGAGARDEAAPSLDTFLDRGALDSGPRFAPSGSTQGYNGYSRYGGSGGGARIDLTRPAQATPTPWPWSIPSQPEAIPTFRSSVPLTGPEAAATTQQPSSSNSAAAAGTTTASMNGADVSATVMSSGTTMGAAAGADSALITTTAASGGSGLRGGMGTGDAANTSSNRETEIKPSGDMSLADAFASFVKDEDPQPAPAKPAAGKQGGGKPRFAWLFGTPPPLPANPGSGQRNVNGGGEAAVGASDQAGGVGEGTGSAGETRAGDRGGATVDMRGGSDIEFKQDAGASQAGLAENNSNPKLNMYSKVQQQDASQPAQPTVWSSQVPGTPATQLPWEHSQPPAQPASWTSQAATQPPAQLAGWTSSQPPVAQPSWASSQPAPPTYPSVPSFMSAGLTSSATPIWRPLGPEEPPPLTPNPTYSPTPQHDASVIPSSSQPTQDPSSTTHTPIPEPSPSNRTTTTISEANSVPIAHTATIPASPSSRLAAPYSYTAPATDKYSKVGDTGASYLDSYLDSLLRAPSPVPTATAEPVPEAATEQQHHDGDGGYSGYGGYEGGAGRAEGEGGDHGVTGRDATRAPSHASFDSDSYAGAAAGGGPGGQGWQRSSAASGRPPTHPGPGIPRVASTGQFSMLQQHIEELTAERMELQRGLQAAVRAHGALEEENAEMVDRLNVQANTIDSLKNKLDRYEMELNAQVLTIEGMASEREAARVAQAEAVQRASALASEVVALEANYLNAKSGSLKLQKDLDNLQAQVSRLTKQLAAAQKDHANANEDVGRLTGEKRALFVRLKQTEARLNKLMDESGVSHKAREALLAGLSPVRAETVDTEIQCTLLDPTALQAASDAREHALTARLAEEAGEREREADSRLQGVLAQLHGLQEERRQEQEQREREQQSRQGSAGGGSGAGALARVHLSGRRSMGTALGSDGGGDGETPRTARAEGDTPRAARGAIWITASGQQLRNPPSVGIAARALGGAQAGAAGAGGVLQAARGLPAPLLGPLAQLARWLPATIPASGAGAAGTSPAGTIVQEHLRAATHVHELLGRFEEEHNAAVEAVGRLMAENRTLRNANDELRRALEVSTQRLELSLSSQGVGIASVSAGAVQKGAGPGVPHQKQPEGDEGRSGNSDRDTSQPQAAEAMQGSGSGGMPSAHSNPGSNPGYRSVQSQGDGGVPSVNTSPTPLPAGDPVSPLPVAYGSYNGAYNGGGPSGKDSHQLSSMASPVGGYGPGGYGPAGFGPGGYGGAVGGRPSGHGGALADPLNKPLASLDSLGRRQAGLDGQDHGFGDESGSAPQGRGRSGWLGFLFSRQARPKKRVRNDLL